MAAGSAHPASANSLVARAGRGDEGEPARGSTRLASSRPRPADQRRKGKSHVTPARRRRRHPGPGCRGAVLRAQARCRRARRLTWRRQAASVCGRAPFGQLWDTCGRRFSGLCLSLSENRGGKGDIWVRVSAWRERRRLHRFPTCFVRSHAKLQSGPIRLGNELSPLNENAAYIRLSEMH